MKKQYIFKSEFSFPHELVSKEKLAFGNRWSAVTTMDDIKPDNASEVPSVPSNEEAQQSDSHSVDRIIAQEGQSGTKVDQRVRDELIALCQAQQEQRRRIDAANQRRGYRAHVDKETHFGDGDSDSMHTSPEIPVVAVPFESNHILHRLSSEASESVQA